MESEKLSEIKNNWPPSNYPIFLALVLLAATAVTLAMGDETQAEELAIYAYYFLVIGVGIRFFELALPENSIDRVASIYGFVTKSTKRHTLWVKNFVKQMFGNITPKLNVKMSLKDRINAIRHFNDNSYLSRLQQKITKSYEGGINVSKYMDEISYTTRNVAILLSVFFFISLIYGVMIDWLFVKKYLSNLVLIIFGFLTLHIFTRKKTSIE